MRALLAACALAAVLSACTRAVPLQETFASPEAVASAVLDAYAAGDRERLTALALSEAEFGGVVWPELPAARPERNLPLSYVWGDLHQKSGHSLDTLLGQHGGRRYALVGVEFGARTPYASYIVHRRSTFVIRDADGERRLRLCGSMIERGGRWKVFSYVVDD